MENYNIIRAIDAITSNLNKLDLPFFNDPIIYTALSPAELNDNINNELFYDGFYDAYPKQDTFEQIIKVPIKF